MAVDNVSPEEYVKFEQESNIVDIGFNERVYAYDTSVKQTETIPYGITQALQNDLNFYENLGTPPGQSRVCVADTGYDWGHEDLPRDLNVMGRDNSENGAWNIDINGHGTHVAGTVAANGGDAIGVRGIIPDNQGGKFKLIIGKALNSQGSGSFASIMETVDGCISDGANVINLSLGTTFYSSILDEFFRVRYEENNILFVAAAGNGGNSAYSYPASFSSVMSVGGHDHVKNKYTKSQFNDQVEISGPAVFVYSTTPGNSYSFLTGTSMATPHVAGVAGLLRMHFPECTNYQIRNALLRSAEDIGNSGCDFDFGFGAVQGKSAYLYLCQGNCGAGAISTPIGGCNQASSVPVSIPDTCLNLSTTEPIATTPAPTWSSQIPSYEPSNVPTTVPSNAASPLSTPAVTNKASPRGTPVVTNASSPRTTPKSTPVITTPGLPLITSTPTLNCPSNQPFAEIKVKIYTDAYPEETKAKLSGFGKVTMGPFAQSFTSYTSSLAGCFSSKKTFTLKINDKGKDGFDEFGSWEVLINDAIVATGASFKKNFMIKFTASGIVKRCKPRKSC